MRHPAILICGLLFAGSAHALRCGGNVVSEGDDVYTLTRYCGRPARVEEVKNEVVTSRIYDPYTGQYVVQSVANPYEIWFYNFGPRRLIAKITVRKGRITRIESEGYGH